MRVVQQGDKVRVHYVKCFQDGSTVSSRGKAPTELTVGITHPRLPGLGLELVGLAIGEKRTLMVPASQAYGAYDSGRVRRLDRTRFAEHKTLTVGEWVRAWDRRHRRRLVRIVELHDNMVVVDVNHRWAGQSVQLEVEVLAILDPETASGSATAGYGADIESAPLDERCIREGGQE